MPTIRFFRIIPWAFFLLLSVNKSEAQPSMQQGFDLLEEGAFNQAAIFFTAYLKKDSTNRTAKLCYGRAVGLAGDAARARKIFGGLLESYPDDPELEVNYAESLLWEKRYGDARDYYGALLQKHGARFDVVLGYANTLSNLKEYQEADSLASRALQIKPGDPSALISRKFIRLGMAYGEMQAQRYERAGRMLDSLALEYAGDIHVVRLQAEYAIQTSDYKRAREYFRQLEAAGDSLSAWNGEALSWQLQGRPSRSLRLATDSWERVGAHLKSYDTRAVWKRYVQALIWNRRYVQAAREMEMQRSEDSLLALDGLEAQWGMYTGRYGLSEARYRSMITSDPCSFEGNLGLANALIAQGKYLEGYRVAQGALRFFQGHNDAKLLAEKAMGPFRPHLETRSSWSVDNGFNTAFSNGVSARLPIHPKWDVSVSYTDRNTENTQTGARARTLDAGMSLAFRTGGSSSVEASFSGIRVVLDEEAYTRPQMGLQFRFQPFRKQQGTLYYRRSVQTFNADLIARDIELNHLGASYHLSTNAGIGWYSQGTYNLQSDANSSLQLFSSLYLLPLTKPTLKTGINVQYLGFSEQRPEIYFSPERYTAWDIFMEYAPKLTESTTLRMLGASGSQRIDQGGAQWTLRAELQFRKDWGKQLSTELFGNYTSQASATAAGFQFTQAGLRVRWTFRNPVFEMPSSE